ESTVEHAAALRPRLGEQPAEEERLELLGRGLGLVGLGLGLRRGRGVAGERVGLHSVSRSARSAPAALSGRRIETRSRGLAPSDASAAATSPTVAARLTSRIGWSASLTLTLLCGTTLVVAPLLSGPGCETCWVSSTSTVSAPNVIAAV